MVYPREFTANLKELALKCEDYAGADDLADDKKYEYEKLAEQFLAESQKYDAEEIESDLNELEKFNQQIGDINKKMAVDISKLEAEELKWQERATKAEIALNVLKIFAKIASYAA